MVNTEDIAEKHFQNYLKQLEDSYNAKKLDECADLHNAIVRLMSEHNATIQNALYVVEIIAFELKFAKLNEINGNVKLVEGVLPLNRKVVETTPLVEPGPLSTTPTTDGSDLQTTLTNCETCTIGEIAETTKDD